MKAGDPVPEGALGEAGVAIEKVVGHLVERQVDGLAIASALLGGALSMLARSLDDRGVEAVLQQAIASVRRGELRAPEA